MTAQLPDVPVVASFDTAFHAALPDATATYPVPREWRERYAAWTGLTVNRYARSPGTIWHGSHDRAAYERHAAGLGLPLDPEFYTEGHQGKPGWKKG